jgi:hypothetical protein
LGLTALATRRGALGAGMASPAPEMMRRAWCRGLEKKRGGLSLGFALHAWGMRRWTSDLGLDLPVLEMRRGPLGLGLASPALETRDGALGLGLH